jgi:hypothetical protein
VSPPALIEERLDAAQVRAESVVGVLKMSVLVPTTLTVVPK